MNKTLLNEISYIDDSIELDILWTLLKRKDLGISRKLVCMGFFLELDTETVLEEAAKDEEGRILDKVNRLSIHDALIKLHKEIDE